MLMNILPSKLLLNGLIRAEINEIETKKTIAKINKTKSCFFEKIKLINH